MCVIVHQPTGEHLTKETCRKLWKENADGGGFAFVDDNNNVRVEKAMDFTTFWSLFEQARSAFPHRDFLLHMRIATHGSVKIENVHPFIVDDDTVMGHNGIIHGVPDYDDDRTDTEVFIAEVLPQLPDGWQDNYYLSEMVEQWIGWSRLGFLTVSPHLERTVYRMGDWEKYEGLWLSNKNGLWESNKIVISTVDYLPARVYNKTSEDWANWYDTDRADSYSEWETDLYKLEIEAERTTMEIPHKMIQLGSDYECCGCNKVIDPGTAECECWDTVCSACWQFVARCSTEGECFGSTHYDYKGLTTANRNLVDGNHRPDASKLVTVEDVRRAAAMPGTFSYRAF